MNPLRVLPVALLGLSLVASAKTPVLAAGLVSNAPPSQVAESAAIRPHILFIIADQLRADALGAYGNLQVKTPNVDALAAEGIRFEHCFCAFPVCTPSRYSILSGVPVHEHRGWSNHCTMAPGTVTFPELLRQAGYRTKAVGKMHFTPTYADYGLSQLVLAEQNGPGRWEDDYHRYLRRLGLVDALDLQDQERAFRRQAPPGYWQSFGAQPSNLPESAYSTTWIGDRAVETLQGWDPAVPALLMVGFIKPHHPFDAPERWARMYDPQKMKLLPGWTPTVSASDLALSKGYFDNRELTQAAVRRCTASYYASISELDFQLGRMLAVLKAKGLDDSTLIVLTADHGEYLGFHHLILKANHMYDPLARVPLIIRPSGHHAAGSVSEALVSNTDLAPTILGAAGLRPAPAMKGHDLLAGAAGRDIVFSEAGDGYIMARTASHKLLWRKQAEDRLFFDLAADPLELTNRIKDASCQPEVARLTKAVRAWRPGPVTPAYVDEDAPRIAQPNVPAPGLRREQRQWFSRQMQAWFAKEK